MLFNNNDAYKTNVIKLCIYSQVIKQTIIKRSMLN